MFANSKSKIELVFSGGSVSGSSLFGDIPTLRRALDLLKKEGVDRIDTAHLYGDSEELLRKAEAGTRVTIDSKIKGGFRPGSACRSNVIKGADLSLRRLKVDKLGIFYIHAPDYAVPLSETLEAVNDVFKAGKFDRFDLSNYKPKDVEAIYNHCKTNGYPLPVAYQGNYSAVARNLESEFIPMLRKLSISLYVSSPMAGGFLTKTKSKSWAVPAGSMSPAPAATYTPKCTRNPPISTPSKNGTAFRKWKGAVKQLWHIVG